MHLGVVVSGDSETFDELSDGAFAAGLPVDDAHDDLLAVTHVGIGAFREVDVHGHPARIGADEDLMGPDLGDADIGFAGSFDDAGDLAFELSVASAVDDGHLDPVSVEGVVCVAGLDEYVVFEPLDGDVDGSRLGHAGNSLVVGAMLLRESVLLACALLDNPLVEESAEDLEGLAAALLRGAARYRREVFQGKLRIGEVAEQMQDDLRAVGAFGSLGSLVGASLLFFIHRIRYFSRICRASLYMNPIPVSMARSSGLKVPVWERPAAVPTPRR